ncbi:MAG: proteasome assembly chaperone family protein [Thermoplasmata archaeon]
MEFTWQAEGTDGSGVGRGAVLLSAFPSAGLASIVAGHYIVRSLHLERVARFESGDVAPIAVIQGGVVNPTIRVYGRSDLALVLSEFPPAAGPANAIARTILDQAEKAGARSILCLEGVVPHPEEEDGAATADTAPGDEQVWVAYSRKDPDFVAPFEAAKARTLEDGVIGGVSGALLVQAMGRKVPVAVLLVSARVAEGLPDHRAGAALIETLDRVLPQLKIDTKPLRAQAEQIEKALRAVMRSNPRSADGSPGPSPDRPTSPEMYG